jgi:hypothetical protein
MGTLPCSYRVRGEARPNQASNARRVQNGASAFLIQEHTAEPKRIIAARRDVKCAVESVLVQFQNLDCRLLCGPCRFSFRALRLKVLNHKVHHGGATSAFRRPGRMAAMRGKCWQFAYKIVTTRIPDRAKVTM